MKNKISNKLFGYIKLGRLNKPIADVIGTIPADIYIDYNGLRHIEKGRASFLKECKLDALNYVKSIVDNYTEIRLGKNDKLLLVAFLGQQKKINVSVLELKISNSNCYVVVTATPRRKVTNEEVLLGKK